MRKNELAVKPLPQKNYFIDLWAIDIPPNAIRKMKQPSKGKVGYTSIAIGDVLDPSDICGRIGYSFVLRLISPTGIDFQLK